MSGPHELMVPLERIAPCFEGIVPAAVCSCSGAGVPNVTFLSIVHRIDARHVGLSFQFFNKTRKNLQENPQVQVIVVSPATSDQYRLDLRYARTEVDGPAFDRMKTRLDAIASQSGMSRVFSMRGVDVYEVLDCRPVNVDVPLEAAPKTEHLRDLESFTEQLGTCEDLDTLLSTALAALSRFFDYGHSFVMFPDEDGTHLYTGASHGFVPSGVGSEAVIGEGMLGIAAERRTAVRVTNVAREMLVARAVRSGVERRGDRSTLEREIALPGLPNVQSQLVLPLLAHNALLGVLCLQSQTPGRFLETDERVMQIAARHLAASMAHTRLAASAEQNVAAREPDHGAHSAHAVIKHYGSDDSIFVDDEYLIKGIPGRLLWKLLQIFLGTGRAAFTNKEIRLDASLGLPDIKDNLETRLILLRRRLEERCQFLKLVHVGRGRLQLEVRRGLTLEELP